MNRHGATKDEIIRLISKGENTLSTICIRLDLAPSTVSKHLHDLEEEGVIRQKESHFRKWKHYEVVPGAGVGPNANGAWASKAVAISAIAAIAFIAALYIMVNNTGAQAGASYVPISITDPPQVPLGTQALYINYSSLSVETGGSSPAWMDINSSGRLDLLSLVNRSQVIGLAGVSPGSVIRAVRFNITSAQIEIYNSTYQVYLPDRQVTAYVGNKTVNASSDILIDFAPAIAPIVVNGSVHFVLVPRMGAAIASRAGAQQWPGQGFGIHLNSPLGMPPAGLFPGRLNATIANASLSFYGDNGVRLSAELDNRMAENLTVISVLVQNATGRGIDDFWMGQGFRGAQDNASNGTQQQGGAGGWRTARPGWGQGRLYRESNSSIMINASAIYPIIASGNWTGPINITLPSPANHILISGGPGRGPAGMGLGLLVSNGGLDLIALRNGSIVQSDNDQFGFAQRSGRPPIGYNVAAHSDAALSYNGTLNGTSRLNPSGHYRLIVFTDMGPLQANVTVG